ncbi:MAG: TlyA family RNA methyltransferase [Methylacidiphilales bacterium]|nr:TlyA family RNA methyltransferase [Candidatus Methylacidiphilales bacterium]MDW8349406.1 TlyA family RNA methyltransferase [Verrucomicrobiae bacterium]
MPPSSPHSKKRLDLLLCEIGLAPSREKAQAYILAGEVLVNGQPVTKPSHLCSSHDSLTLRTPDRYVSRGGYKLEAALDHFKLDLSNTRVLDIGASTGGFTDCALQHGATHVVALDVGRNQIAWKLRQDPRVTILEKINARFLSPSLFPAQLLPFDVILMDVSFISQKLIWPTLPPLIRNGGSIVTLIKPQFEASPQEVSQGGIVKDISVHNRIISEITTFIHSLNTFHIRGVIPSPILGKEGNQEYLLCAQKNTSS